MPTHNHSAKNNDANDVDDYCFNVVRHLGTTALYRGRVSSPSSGTIYAILDNQSAADSLGNKDIGYSESTTDTGGNAAHSLMQPFLSVFMWRRTN